MLQRTQDLFLELATDEEQLDFPFIYASRPRGHAPLSDPTIRRPDSAAALRDHLERGAGAAKSTDGPLQMLVTTLDYDDYQGRSRSAASAAGRHVPGMPSPASAGMAVCVPSKVVAVFTFEGLRRVDGRRGQGRRYRRLTGIEDARSATPSPARSNPRRCRRSRSRSRRSR